MKRLAAALLTLSLSLGLAACGGGGGGGGGNAGGGGGGGAEEGPITLGLITSLTGNYKPLGTNDKKGAELAVKQINDAGGILGRKVRLIVKNDQTDPNQAVIAFNDLLGEDVDAVIGPVFSNSSLAVIPLAQRNKVPYVSTSASDEQVNPTREYAFMTPPTASLVAERHMQHFQAVGMTKIAIAHDTQSSYAVTGYKASKKLASKYGVQFVADETFETTTSDFSSLFTHVRDSGADALMVWATGAPAVVITKQFGGADLNMELVMTGAECSTLYSDPAGKAAEGVLIDCVAGAIGPSLPDSELKQTVMKVAKPFEAKYGYYPPQFAFDAVTAVQVVAAAIDKAGSTDAQDVQAALENLTLLTPSGTFDYTPTKHYGLSLGDLTIIRVKDGKFVPTDWGAQELKKEFG